MEKRCLSDVTREFEGKLEPKVIAEVFRMVDGKYWKARQGCSRVIKDILYQMQVDDYEGILLARYEQINRK